MKRLSFVGAAAIVALATGLAARQDAQRLTADTFKDIQIRSLGPNYTTGRVTDLAVDPNHPSTYYVAAAAGGLWKSENRGNNWTPVFDSGGSYNLCCVVVDPKNSDVVWLGTGESSNPRSAMVGAGLYKSTDGAKTWTRVGLADSEHLGRIVLDPRNSNVVYVAAQGPLWSAGGDRGVYKTTDGGATWKAVLTVSPDTGGNDLQIDPNNPDVIYASTWQRRRGVGQMIGGGPESAIYKSINGGATWTKLTKGLPTGDMGRIALGADPKAKPTRVYALVNALPAETGFYRSDDAGATWERMGAPLGKPSSAPPDVQAAQVQAATAAAAAQNAAAGGAQGRAGAGGAGAGGGGGRRGGVAGVYTGGDPGYYYKLFVDPVRPDTIWSVETNLQWSRDGGKTFTAVPSMNGVHVDFHVVWIDPKDSTHILVGSDGGAFESVDDAKTWRHFANLPITQFYRVAVDNALPFYHVCGGAQDNGSMCGPSRSVNRSGIPTSDWVTSGGGDGFFNQIDPEDPNTVYSSSQDGAIERMDIRTGQGKGIRPPESQGPGRGAGGGGAGGAGGAGGGLGAQPSGRGDRTNWDCPYIISPFLHTRLYWGSQYLYRSDDRGDHWTKISPDLTRNLDYRVIPIMGKVWNPTTTVAYNNATTTLSDIVAIDESPLLEGLIYVGTDDGNLQVTEDGGKSWRKTTQFANAKDGIYLTHVIASPRDSNVVFVSLNNWQRGDFTPYLVRSDDRGRTFKSIAGDLPAGQDVWTVLQDPVNGNLLFAGTEFGLFFTVDGGNHWTQLKGMPVAQVRELKFQKRENDLVMATFGRGFFILDDYSAFREITAQSLGDEGALYPLRMAYQYEEQTNARTVWGNTTTPNPPMGAILTYSLGPSANGTYAISIADDAGHSLDRIEVASQPGVHRVAWNLRIPQAGGGGRGAGGGGGRGGGGGTPVSPGRYTATLVHGSGDAATAVGQPQSFSVVPLPDRPDRD
jgi:photosystem II stability/assembly factor-like uncharacterized protein